MTTIPRSFHDLLDAPGIAILSTIGRNGVPQTTAVWFLVEDGVAKISLNTERQKVKNLKSNCAVTVFFVDPSNPFRTLEIRAHAELLLDDENAFADRVGAKYGVSLRDMDTDQPGARPVAVFAPDSERANGQSAPSLNGRSLDVDLGVHRVAHGLVHDNAIRSNRPGLPGRQREMELDPTVGDHIRRHHG